MSDTNKALVSRARRGDGQALELLVRRHLRAACAVALAILGNPSDAEDLAQDSFVVAFERLDTCRDPERFAGWFLQIVRSRALNALAQGKLRGALNEQVAAPQPAAHGQGAGEEAERVWLRQRLLQALGTLSQAQREVVVLHDLEGWTHPEIAELLSISDVMSRQHLFTARRALRERLNEGSTHEADHER